MVTPKTGNPRGRPPKKYRDDPDRYATAFAGALQALGASEAAAFTVAAAQFVAGEVAPEKTRRRQPLGTEAIAWEARRAPGAVSLPNKATTLRVKSKRGLSAEDAEHQAILTEACKISIGTKNAQVVIPLVRGMLMIIGELEFGDKCLVPMIRAKGEC
jgi:hypothetical protein